MVEKCAICFIFSIESLVFFNLRAIQAKANNPTWKKQTENIFNVRKHATAILKKWPSPLSTHTKTSGGVTRNFLSPVLKKTSSTVKQNPPKPTFFCLYDFISASAFVIHWNFFTCSSFLRNAHLIKQIFFFLKNCCAMRVFFNKTLHCHCWFGGIKNSLMSTTI